MKKNDRRTWKLSLRIYKRNKKLKNHVVLMKMESALKFYNKVEKICGNILFKF